MIPQQRKQVITDLVRKNKAVKVTDLSERLHISDVTIRRDLKELEDAGILTRTHGGAIRRTNTAFEPQISILETEHVPEKTAIAKEAYKLINENDAIILDSSSTAARLAEFIIEGDKKNITVVTNSFKTAFALIGSDNVELIHIGGQVRVNIYSSIGTIAENALKNLRVDKAFIGINGIDFGIGLTTQNLYESQIKRVMMESSNQVYILADNSKFNQTFLSIVCPIEEVDFIITDNKVSDETVEKTLEQDVEIIIAE
jgi:DeoR family transcriptional regulator, fructose operon transcriptional repressor